MKNNALDQIRDDRAKTHGKFEDGAKVFEILTAPVAQALNDGQISDVQHYGLIMAMSKVTRILVGDPNEKDHWIDGANYLLLGGGVNDNK